MTNDWINLGSVYKNINKCKKKLSISNIIFDSMMEIHCVYHQLAIKVESKAFST